MKWSHSDKPMGMYVTYVQLITDVCKTQPKRYKER